MILVALGSNLKLPEFGGPRQILDAALNVMPSFGISVVRRSSFFSSAPVPASDQPWFLNAVACVETSADPAKLLTKLHAIETRFGRKRGCRNESRTLDLDLLAYGRQQITILDGLVVPHPRIAERTFVLKPILEVAPGWRHPVTGKTAAEMLTNLPEGQQIRRLESKP